MQRHSVQTFKCKNRISVLSLILGILVAFCAITIPKNTDFYNTIPNNNLDFDIVDGCSGASDEAYVHIGGTPIGISIKCEGLIVMGKSEVMTKDGNVCPVEGLDISKGDILISVDGEKVTSVYQLKTIMDRAKGAVKLTMKRADGERQFDVRPVYDEASMQNRLGLMLKEDVGGVGTLTFVTQNGAFAALGHYIFDAETGLSDELDRGNIYRACVDGVIRGEKGKAGGLLAEVNRLSEPVGEIRQNSSIGLYGTYSGDAGSDLIRIARKGEAKIGAAKLLATVDGCEPEFYDIEIVKVVSQSSPAEKGMIVLVRDKRLLERTGGIVQGMSGSPIVQNGALIGAVTHVFVQDPTRGYAVHSRFMYDRAVTFGSQGAVEYLREAA